MKKYYQTKNKYYIITGIIKENRRMNKQVEKILQSAQLERDEIKLQLRKIDVHALINKVAENTKLQLEEVNATLSTKLNATQFVIYADD